MKDVSSWKEAIKLIRCHFQRQNIVGKEIALEKSLDFFIQSIHTIFLNKWRQTIPAES